MKICTLVFAICFLSITASAQLSNEQLRNRYASLANNANLCKNTINELTGELQPLQQAYLGASQTIWAKHAFSPLTKLKSFKKGTKNIDAAVQKSPNDIEIRMLRYSVQLNAPSFLGYNHNLKQDKQFLQHNKGKLNDQKLLAIINQLLLLKK